MGDKQIRLMTEVSLPDVSFDIGLQSKVLAIGSCFAEAIGGQMQRHKFSTFMNPLGIVFNPASIAQTIQIITKGALYPVDALVEHDGVWHSFDFHSRFSNIDKEVAVQQMNNAVSNASSFWAEMDVLMLTFGTAFTFRQQKNHQVVANCHKFPAEKFTRTRLEVKEIVDLLSPIFQQLENREKPVPVILTVSPVRHIKDGLIDNQRSKATLLLAAEALVSKFSNVSYFPSYELMVDELRDYRFYGSDLIHPSALAVEYIWQKFKKTFFTSKTIGQLERIGKLIEASNHRPRFPKSQVHLNFVEKTMESMTNLEKEIAGLSFSEEISRLKKALPGNGE